MKNIIIESLKNSIKTQELVMTNQADNIELAAKAIIKAFSEGNKLIVFGNGGSAADSQHMAAELVGRFKKERRALPAISLTTDTSIITSIGNDYGYEMVFARQIEALGRTGDMAIGISTSGNSENVIRAINKAKAMGLKTMALTGGDGGKLSKLCDIAIVIDTNDVPRIQEAHIIIIHILCDLIEKALFK